MLPTENMEHTNLHTQQTTGGMSMPRLIVFLGVPAFGLSLSITLISTYMPVVIRDFTDSGLAIGAIVGGEGAFSLFLPMVIGSWSDRVQSPIGNRLPFLLVGALLAGSALALVAVIHSLAAIIILVAIFFVGYFTYYPPYRALLPDLVPQGMQGRAQSSQAFWRGLGLGAALVAGGTLFTLWQPLPFVLAAGVLIVITGVFTLRLRSTLVDIQTSSVEHEGFREVCSSSWDLLKSNSDLRAFAGANALWEFSLAAMKTFVVLFIVVGLGKTVGIASLIIGIVAAASVAAAVLSGFLSDRIGVHRLLSVALPIYGFGLLLLVFTQSVAIVVPVMPAIALGGAVVLTLPYALLTELMPKGKHGAISGLFGLSRGLGVVLGPLIAGAAIDIFQPWLESTDGYAAVWLVAGAAVLLSIPLQRKMRKQHVKV